MAEIAPFRGIRYNDATYADLSPVLAPPYDVISQDDLRRLLDRSDRNAVRLILGDKLPDRSADPKKYASVAQRLEDWLMDETLIQDRAPALYLLDQEFEDDGERKVRRAFVARLRIEAFGKGCVFPHEQTMPGPKADRLALMKATRMNMSQIFGLYPGDPSVRNLLDRMAELDPVAEGTGIDGVRNVLRVVYHHKLVHGLVEALKNKQILVADGHHRYETAVAYRDEIREQQGPLFDDGPHEFVAVALVAMDDPGLVIRPTHRLVDGVADFSPDALFRRAEDDYEVEEIEPDPAAILRRLTALADRHAFGLVTAAGARVLVRRSGRRAAAGSPQGLDTHILHHDVFGEMLALGPDSWKKGGPVRYLQDPSECIAAVQRGDAQLAALVNPTRMDEVRAVAMAGRTMPPKSTYFYPKLPSGTVINPLI